MPTSSRSLSRRERVLVCGQLWLLEILALTRLCAEYAGATRPETLRGGVFVYAGALSCAASLSLLPGLLSLLAAAFVRARLTLGLACAALWSSALFLVYVDTRIYGIFRYHFNGLVWNVLTTPGADEAVHLSTRDLVLVSGVFAALLPLHLAAHAWLSRLAAKRAEAAQPLPLAARPSLAWSLVLVPNMLLVAGVYAWADLTRDPHVMAFARVYPLYPRMTVKRFAERHLGIAMKERPEVEFAEGGIQLDYPHVQPALDPAGPRPNVLVIAIDSLRADMLVPEVMPHTCALAARARVFRDHLSGGNGTRFGVFSLVYGLHGSYWKPVYSEHRSPVMVDALLANGYDARVLTSASMDFPEFRSTAWVRMEDRVEDRLPSERAGGRDDGVALRFEQWLDERPKDAPFFAFLLLDAPHQRYFFPEECAVFRPYVDEIAYTSIGDEASPSVREGLFNRYRNAVHYADQVTGRILDALDARGLRENTLVAVTGDHGEEFFENGFWGHTSNFSPAQVHVPFVLAGPGIPPGEERRPTSHVDFPATVLELLGADPALRAQWCLGANLLDPPAERRRVISGWDTLGLHAGEEILEIPMAGYGGADIAVYDRAWRRTFEDEAVLRREGRALGVLALECRQFLR